MGADETPARQNGNRLFCGPCLAMPLGVPIYQLHERLAHQERRDFGPGTADHYLCLDCDTRWIRVLDRWGLDWGIRLAARERRPIGNMPDFPERS